MGLLRTGLREVPVTIDSIATTNNSKQCTNNNSISTCRLTITIRKCITPPGMEQVHPVIRIIRLIIPTTLSLSTLNINLTCRHRHIRSINHQERRTPGRSRCIMTPICSTHHLADPTGHLTIMLLKARAGHIPMPCINRQMLPTLCRLHYLLRRLHQLPPRPTQRRRSHQQPSQPRLYLHLGKAISLHNLPRLNLLRK
jgi:hypothetical protein